jgi:D-alanine-D-alanine ligase
VKIGLTYNLRSSAGDPHGSGSQGAGWPDDAEEEFDSPETIQTLSRVLESFGHEVELLGDGMAMLRRLVDGSRPELVFNFAEGTGSGRSREARVPAVLEMLDIPYTGSDPLTLSTTLDKPCAKQLVRGAGLATPDWLVVDGDVAEVSDRLLAMPLPVIVKPAFEGSSKGIHSTNLVEEPDRLLEVVEQMSAQYRQPVLVEEFIDGDELTVGIVGHRPRQVLGVMRVVPREASDRPFIYSLEVKRNMDLVHYECPAQLSPADMRAVETAALAVWRTLGCRDVARIDFRLRNHVPYFLEVNPLPGLNPLTSDLPIIGRALGIDYPELIGRIVQAATERLGENAVAAR